jgi:hypothetical protein
MKLLPNVSVSEADKYYRMWCFDANYRAKMAKALKMAGLREDASETPTPAEAATRSPQQ